MNTTQPTPSALHIDPQGLIQPVQQGVVINDAQARVICRAYQRPFPHYICPTPGLWAASQNAMIAKLVRIGLAKYHGLAPVLTEAGLATARASGALTKRK